ncbi:hypothetical protein ONO86_00749 [Micromonospora noduli]|nr:hypothetical protein ONO86_00749 [Micromonospora noduli]
MRVRRGQRSAVHLAVGGDRQRRQRHVPGRHHRLGQPGREVGAQLTRRDRGVVRDDVGDEPTFVAVPVHRDGGGPDARAGGEGAGDLVRLDPDTADLDLLVGPAQALQLTVLAPPHHVTRAVDAGAGLEGARHEPLGGQVGPADVPVRETGAADEQLPRSADAGQPAVVVEDVEQLPTDRSTDRGPRRVAGQVGHVPGAGERGALGRAVPVDEAQPRQGGGQRGDPAGVGRLAAEVEGAQRSEHRRVGVHAPVEQGGGEHQHRDAVLGESVTQPGRREHVVLGDAHQARAVEQRTPHLEARRVERHVGRLCDRVGGPDGEVVGAVNQPDDPAVGGLDPLRPPCRPGGVQDAGPLGRVRQRPRRRGPSRGQHQPVEPQHRQVVDDGHRTVGEQQPRPAVAQHELPPRLGVGRVQGQVRRPGGEHREHRHDELGGRAHRQADDAARGDPVSGQDRRQGVGPGAHLGVREGGAVVLQSDGVRCRLGLGEERRRHTRRTCRTAAGAPLDDQRALLRRRVREGGDRRLGVGQGVVEQRQVVVGEPAHRRAVEQVRVVGEDAERPVGPRLVPEHAQVGRHRPGGGGGRSHPQHDRAERGTTRVVG